jgi:DNA-binding GntR family transcriptional regulator
LYTLAAVARPRTTNGKTPTVTESRVLVDSIAATIQARIMDGTIPIGSWLRQEVLAEEFGASRTPVREALRQLHASGAVELVPHRGALVRGPTLREIREAYEVRAELEGFAAALAATHIDGNQLKRLGDAEELFRRTVADLVAGRPGRQGKGTTEEAWFRANTLFHEVVQEASRNLRLIATIANLHQAFPRNLTWVALRDDPRLLEKNVEEHRRVLEAIEHGNEHEARTTMTEHIRRSGALVVRWFELRDDAAIRAPRS